MNLPLLALKPCGVGAPFPEPEVKLRIEFKNGQATVTTLEPNGSRDKSDPLVQAADRLRNWVCEGIVKLAGPGQSFDGGRTWKISWENFNKSVAMHTCTSANSAGGAQKGPLQYALTRFEQHMLGSEGHQELLFTFAVYIDR